MLTIDMDDPNTVLFKGKAVGHITTTGGLTTVTLSISYSCEGDDWVIPLAHLGQGLRKVEPPLPPVEAEITTAMDGVDWAPNVPQFLTEKTVKSAGRWRFHKNDVDPWPSRLHGHDYERGSVIDGITGEIYDATTRRYQGKLTRRELSQLHKALREASDLAHLMHLLPATP